MVRLKGLKFRLRAGCLKEYKNCIEDLLINETVQMMRHFRHHHQTTCLEHALNVSYYSYLICKNMRLDYVAAARGGLLHDLFLYDWRVAELERGKHAFRHPGIALENAERIFTLNEIEQDIIKKHMWPLTIIPPMYYESLIVCIVDKYCATLEIVNNSKLMPTDDKSVLF